MSDIKWKKKYEIGHERIDFEHQIFVDLIAKIDDAVQLKKDPEYTERLLDELRAYATFHFISEENIMYTIDYPDYKLHTQHHNNLLEVYSRKMMAIDLGEETTEDLIVFLKDWFVSHTLTEDLKIAEFVKDQSV